MIKRAQPRLACGALAAAFVAVLVLAALPSPRVHALGTLVQKTSSTASGAATVSLSFASAPTANDLLVVICGASTATTITAPSGFSTAKNESTAPSQGIFYKVSAGGESNLTCGGGTTSTRWGIQIYEYANMATTSPLDAVNTASSSGTSTSASSGTVTTTNANDIVLTGVISATSTAITTWTNSFVSENSQTISGGTKMAIGGADRVVSATGSYSTVATVGSAAWRGQIAAFKQAAYVFTGDIVDGSGNAVASPSVSMTSSPRSFSCQTVTGTLGAATQKIRVKNTTANPAWTLTIAATSGATSSWSAGTPKYDFNDPTSSGCGDGSDVDTLAGDLSINPATGTITPQTGCATTGVSLGSSASFNEGTLNSLTLATATASASVNCYWDFTGILLSQTIPATQQAGAYAIGMTITLTAN